MTLEELILIEFISTMSTDEFKECIEYIAKNYNLNEEK